MNREQREYAETVRDSATTLLTVINDILDFSKIEAGKLEIEHIDMDLRSTVEEAANLLAIQAHSKGLEVSALIDPSLPARVKGDPGRLRQILLNLGTNAVKFTQRGEIAIQMRAVFQDERGITLRGEVRDTGVGIPADRFEVLFKPFSQVDSSTTRQYGGTGLGLSIVKQLIELMGGEVGVSSVLGEGSLFWFTIRLGTCADQRSPNSIAPTSMDGKRVLIVDDNATNRKVLEGQLAVYDIAATAVSSADDALALLRAAVVAGRPFDIALLDHLMPGCDGETPGKLIREESALRATRMVLLTSSGQRNEWGRFAALGFAGYLLKPVTRKDLFECMARAVATTPDNWKLQTQPVVTSQTIQSICTHGRHRVLLAEDNMVNQKVASRILQKLGYSVDVVANGREAIIAGESGHYDLILMDCQMPELDGYQATRHIRGLEEGRTRLPIIALTANAMKGADALCKDAGMDEHLTKPLDSKLLAAVLATYLRDEENAGPRTSELHP